MENIIFLDIDGVLNNIEVLFNEESINVVKKLQQQYNAKIVMITSWQLTGTTKIKTKIKNILEKYNISNIDFIDPNYEGCLRDIKLPSRLLGIVDYLKNKNSYADTTDLRLSIALKKKEQIIKYIKDHMKKSKDENTKELELWYIWLGSDESEIIYKECSIKELTEDYLEEIFTDDDNDYKVIITR